MTKRVIIESDSLKWLPKNRDIGSIVTSLPDMEETQHTNLGVYMDWFGDAAAQCFKSASDGHPVIFYQTDRLFKGRRLSKAHLLMLTAQSEYHELVWHKIVLRHDVGKADLRRPGYSHLLCFGTEGVRPGKATPDVMLSGGFTYPDGMAFAAARTALQAALQHGKAVADPFCGRGTVPALAEHMGFDEIIGVDIDPEQVAAARALRLYRGRLLSGGSDG
jgi:hypothetical protein